VTNFLTKKIGPVPVWVYGGVALVGSYLLFRKPGKPGSGKDQSGGQLMPYSSYQGSGVAQNIGGDADSINISSGMVYGALTSQINDGFFGQGPLSLWTAGQWTTATYSVDDGGAVIIGDDGPVKNQGTLAMTFLWVLVGTDIIIQKVDVPSSSGRWGRVR